MYRVQFWSFLCLIGCIFCSPSILAAQASEDDSLALVSVYDFTDGPNWINASNWLSGPVSTWHGITVMDSRVIAVELPNNNLQNGIPPELNALIGLQRIDLSGNELKTSADLVNIPGLSTLLLNDNQLEELPQTMSSVLLELDCSNNRLTFSDLEPFLVFSIPSFTYEPQAPVGEDGFIYVTPGSDTSLDLPLTGMNNLYQWAQDETPIGPFIPNSELAITNAMASDEGEYVCTITNSSFPDLILTSVPLSLLLTRFDIAGGEYVPNHLIMEFVDEATQEEKDSLLNFYQATRLDSCLCGVLELWLLPDTTTLPEGEIIIGIEGIKEDAMTKSEIEETGFNYFVELLGKRQAQYAYTQKATTALPPPPPNESDLTVAVIDVGIDLSHTALQAYTWTNEEESENDIDDDGNCLTDDLQGYNFAKRDNLPLDFVNGHGTHVAGIIVDGLLATSEVRLMALKSHTDDGTGTLFNALCGIYYANDKNTRVINLSWGYAGLPSPLLESAISRAGDDCGALVIASAGNNAEDNDATPHYPSSFELDNLISVAALNTAMDSLADFSSYGLQSVDIAAPGERILSTLPGDMTGFKSGTSMAAAAVSNAAIRLFEARPELTYINVREALLSSAEEIGGLEGFVTTEARLDLSAALLAIQNIAPDSSCFMVNSTTDLATIVSVLSVYPQPFRDKITVEFSLPEATQVQLCLLNAWGQVVWQDEQYFGEGQQQYTISDINRNSPRGLYVLQMRIGSSSQVIKLLRQ
ncbi:MAG: S8 family serine peptidase [Bacteroidota bacterium]